MQGLRRWVNSVSIDKERTRVLISEQGEESVEMTVSIRLPFLIACMFRRGEGADDDPYVTLHRPFGWIRSRWRGRRWILKQEVKHRTSRMDRQ
jgi:hypothetical protein